MPFSARLTMCTWRACSAIPMFLCMTPMPPSRAMAMAMDASVTVSIAAETTGMFRVMLREKRVSKLTSRGNTSEYAGTSSTSSKVRPSMRTRSAINDIAVLLLKGLVFIAHKGNTFRPIAQIPPTAASPSKVRRPIFSCRISAVQGSIRFRRVHRIANCALPP